MFKRLFARFRRKPQIVDPLIDVYGIRTTGPRGQSEPVLLRQVPLSSIPPVDGPLPSPSPKRLAAQGADQSPDAVKKRARSWLVSTLPDEAVFR